MKFEVCETDLNKFEKIKGDRYEVINLNDKIKSWTQNLEHEALQQIIRVSNLPFIFKHIAVMPDAHAGKGSTIGSVIATRKAIIPSCVGVDIGCGMTAVKLRFKIEDIGNLSKLRLSIERSIPVGQNQHKEFKPYLFNSALSFFDVLKTPGVNTEKAKLQLGTLGGGNHFIEICKDESDYAWVLLHSGSRNIGKCLAEIHINNAKGIMKDYFIDLEDPDLAYLAENTPEFNNYMHSLMWAQQYAKFNRREMLIRILKDISFSIFNEDKGWDYFTSNSSIIDCHHNYTRQENHFGHNVWVTRKGAVSAREGELGIIPGSMGTKSYIVRGKGNMQSFCSCSHGAGRKMSRTKARNTFTISDLEEQTKNIDCRKDQAVIDEIPSAYKDIDEVMQNQTDLVEIVHTLNQLICIKG